MAAACRGQPCPAKKIAPNLACFMPLARLCQAASGTPVSISAWSVEFDTLDDRTQGPQSLEVTTRLDPQEKICRGRSRGLVHVDNDARRGPPT